MAQGWIKLHRSIREHWIWQDRPFSRGQAWVDMLLMANHKDNKVLVDGMPRLIRRGQFLTSLEKLGDNWGWDRRKVKRFLVALSNDGMLSYEMSRHGTVVTLINYDNFQGNGTADGTSDSPADGSAEGIQTIMNKNDKHGKNPHTHFHSFKQNTYDFDELENKLLGK